MLNVLGVDECKLLLSEEFALQGRSISPSCPLNVGIAKIRVVAPNYVPNAEVFKLRQCNQFIAHNIGWKCLGLTPHRGMAKQTPPMNNIFDLIASEKMQGQSLRKWFANRDLEARGGPGQGRLGLGKKKPHNPFGLWGLRLLVLHPL